MGHVEDRWTRPGLPDRNGRARKEHTERYGKGLRWLATWTEGGRRRSKSFSRREAADTYLAKVTVDQDSGAHISRHSTTVAEFGDRWVTEQIHQKASSAEQLESRWRLHIRPAIGDLRLMDVTSDHIQTVVGAWAKSMAPTTVSVVYGYSAAIFKAAHAKRLVYNSPCVGINLPRIEHERVVPLTTEQVHAIADRITRRYRGMVLLGAATGMRSGELRGLTADRLTWGEFLSVRIDRQLTSTLPKFGEPKTKRSNRVVSVDAQSATSLREHMAEFPPHVSGLIFTGREHGPLARTSAASAWSSATADMGLKERSGWHELRHYHASLLIAAGLSVIAVADRLGHQDSTETLRTYSHLWPTDEVRTRNAVAAQLWVSRTERTGSD